MRLAFAFPLAAGFALAGCWSSPNEFMLVKFLWGLYAGSMSVNGVDNPKVYDFGVK